MHHQTSCQPPCGVMMAVPGNSFFHTTFGGVMMANVYVHGGEADRMRVYRDLGFRVPYRGNLMCRLLVATMQERKLQQQAADWERYLSCSHLPRIDDVAGLHEYFAEAAARTHKDLADVLHTCQVWAVCVAQPGSIKLVLSDIGGRRSAIKTTAPTPRPCTCAIFAAAQLVTTHQSAQTHQVCKLDKCSNTKAWQMCCILARCASLAAKPFTSIFVSIRRFLN